MDQLWEHLKIIMLRDYKWMVCDDFNMMESLEDKSSSCGMMILRI
jgi:hypothetical protein